MNTYQESRKGKAIVFEHDTAGLRARFWSKVDMSRDCWLWQGSVRHGYGRFNAEHKGFGAHRVAYVFSIGPIPDGLIVCHKCDTPLCVRPDHLFLGTNRDNIRDAQAKNRLRKTGTKQSRAVIDKAAMARAKRYRFVSPNGEIVAIHNLRRFCREHQLNTSNMIQVYKGKRQHHKHWAAVEEHHD